MSSVGSELLELKQISFCYSELTFQLQMSGEVVTLVVGGVLYNIRRRDIDRHPDSFLITLVKTGLYHGKKSIHIDRNGELFQYIYAYVVNGSLPAEAISTCDPTQPDNIRKEAEYFGLSELTAACTPNVGKPSTVIRGFADNTEQGELTVDYPVNFTTPLLRALGTIRAQFFVNGSTENYRIGFGHQKSIYKSSTFYWPNVPELLRDAVSSRLTGTAANGSDANIPALLEIPTAKLTLDSLSSIEQLITSDAQRLCPNTTIQMRPPKLVLFQEGGPYELHHESDGRVGTAVVTLYTTCIGGELEITHRTCTEVMDGCNSWVAMHADCTFKISPVSSGTRVALIYGIYAVVRALPEGEPAAKRSKTDGESGEREAYKLDDCLWCHQDEENPPVFDSTRARGADAAAIYAALNQELKLHDSVVLCLQHMYPASLVVPGFLKSTDGVLYHLLRGHYGLQVVYCIVNVKMMYASDCDEYARARLCPGYEPMVDSAKLVIPAPLYSNSVMDYTPYLTARELEERKTVFVVTGLRVRAKG
jgi:hypothetical protein